MLQVNQNPKYDSRGPSANSTAPLCVGKSFGTSWHLSRTLPWWAAGRPTLSHLSHNTGTTSQPLPFTTTSSSGGNSPSLPPAAATTTTGGWQVPLRGSPVVVTEKTMMFAAADRQRKAPPSVCDDGEEPHQHQHQHQQQQQQQQQQKVPQQQQQEVDNDNDDDDHPLSPRYHTYRSSLASRLGVSSSTPPIPPPPANRTRVPMPLDNDWEPRIAAAMVSFDSSDADADDVDAEEEVRQKLVARLERNGTTTSRGWDENDEAAAAAGAEAAAALGVAEMTMAVQSSTGGHHRISSYSAAAPVEFTVQNGDHNGTGDDARTLRLDSPFGKGGPTVAPTTPQSWYSTTSSLTDPMVTPASSAALYRDYHQDSSQNSSSNGLEAASFSLSAVAAAGTTVASVVGTPTRETAPTLPLVSPPRTTATATTSTTAQLAADGTVLYGVRFPDPLTPPSAATAASTGPPQGRPPRGGSAVAPLVPPVTPPFSERPPPSAASSSPPPAPPAHLGQQHKQCVRALLGGGILLLLTAVALALAFVLTHRSATTTTTTSTNIANTNGAPSTSSPFAHVPGGPPAIAPTTTTTTTTTFAPSGVDTGGNPTVVRPSSRPPTTGASNPWTGSPHAVRRPTKPPSRRPHNPPPTSKPTNVTPKPEPSPSRLAEPTSQPSWWDPSYREWVDSLAGAYTSILNYSNAQAAQVSKSFYQEPAAPQRLALEWLLQWHTPLELDRLGPQRLLQRYALAVVYYGTREGLTNGFPRDDDSATQTSTGPTFGQFISSNGDCGWRSSEGGVCALDAVEKFQQRNSGIRLDGTIPAELGFMSTLDSIDWSNNRLHGTLPTELAVLTGLSTLNVRNNQLTGTVPSELAALRSATAILLDGNDLEGSIPSEVCAAFAGSYAPPVLYVDCGGNDPKVSCPPGICCTYCCYEGECQCVYAGTPLERDLC